MRINLSPNNLRCWWEKSKSKAAAVFAIATTVITFLSVEDILANFKIDPNSMRWKIGILIILSALSLLWGAFSFIKDKEKPVVLYSKEKTHIQAEFGNMTDYIVDNKKEQIYTVVIPINTHIDIILDESVIRKESMHGFWLQRIKETGISVEELRTKIFKQIKNVENNRCKIGDTCYLRNIDNVNYLLIATCEVSGTQSTCTELQYFQGLQAMVDALVEHCDKQEKIYIPVIGGGYANIEKTNQQLLRQMSEILVFNCQKLQNDIHIIVFDKLKSDILLSALRPYE